MLQVKILLAFRLPFFHLNPPCFYIKHFTFENNDTLEDIYFVPMVMFCNHVLSLTSLFACSLYRCSCDTQVSNPGCGVQCQQQ